MIHLIAFIIAAIPLIDRIDGVGRMAEICLIAVSLTLLRENIPKKSIYPVLLIFLFSFVLIASDYKNNSLPLNQSISMILSAFYMWIILIYFRQNKIINLLKMILFFSVVNAMLIIFVGIQPDYFSSVVYERSLMGRELFGIELPFIRNAGFFNHYAYGGAYMVLGLYAAIKLVGIKENKGSSVIIGMTIIVLGILVTQSRATWFAFFFFICLSVLKATEGDKKYKEYFNRVFLVVIILTGIIFGIEMFDLLVGMKTSTFDQRVLQTYDGLNLFLKNPVIGSGYGSYFLSHGKDVVLHNGWVIVLYSTGVVGFALFVSIWLFPFVLTKERSKKIEAAVIIVPLMIIMSGSSGLSYYSIWLGVGMSYALVFSGRIRKQYH